MVDVDAGAWGIAAGYHDVAGRWHETPPATRDAYLAAMGADASAAPPPPSHWVVRAGDPVDAGGEAELTLEDGTVVGGIPPDVPLGYHRLRRLDGSLDVGLIVSPGRCHLPPDLHTWGFAAQLPTVRSARSWGMGDLADLRDLAGWSRGLGAGMLLLNPLHAPRPGIPQEPSPYSPSTRRYRNPLYLRLEDVPGWDGGDDGRHLDTQPIVNRDAVYTAKLAALERLWPRFRGDDDCASYCREEGDSLLGYATFCVLAERGVDPLPHPGSAEVRRLQADPETADRIAFHMWVQWLLDNQLRAAGTQGVDLMQDLAVGFDPGGADAWQYQDVLVPSARVGAPPDEFNTAGQDWGLPPFDPWRLRAAGYRPFIETLRNGFRHAGGLRVDHVMGLFRLFWVPLDGSPTDGTYVRYPWQDLLRILALESHRAGAYVVGEDLGTVEDEVRDELARADVLSYRLFWFESKPPSEWPQHALAAVTTHDLPTVAGVWTGADVDDQRAAGVEPNEDGARQLRDRIVHQTGVAPDGPGGECVLIDAPPDPQAILDRIAEHELRLVALINTHGHVDHVGGVSTVVHAQDHDVPVHIHPHDEHMLLDPIGTSGMFGRYLEEMGLDLRPPELVEGLDDGQSVSGAGMTFTCLHTPGHTQGSTCFLLEIAGERPILFSGDHLFAGSIGRTDLPGGSYEQLMQSMAEKILPMSDETAVLPGHGPTTTIGRERAINPFLQELKYEPGPGGPNRWG